ncbi:MAG: Hsp70 family protein [Oscillospiraceae bacterium]|nr:Hsp70 family protein [Oscillospiraceae bacterium]
MKRCVIGLDLGTTCCKALVVDELGNMIAQGSQGYPLISHGAEIEQKAEDWVSAASTAIRMALQDVKDAEVVAISLSTQGGSTVATDEKGDFIGNAWTWMDTRCTLEAEAVERALTDEYIYKTTGWKIDPSLDAAKILRMKSMEEYRSAKKYITTLEVVNRWLTGKDVIDPTNCAIRQLWNIEKNDWDEKILSQIGLSREELPPVMPTGAFVGNLTEDCAKELGLPETVKVFNGAHDQYCASIGAGAVQEGDMLLSAGTTWVLMGISKSPLFTESYIAPGKHPVEGLYGAIASLVCSGASLQWFKNNFLPEEFDEMNRVVATRRDKTGELTFFPYMAGANYPLWQLNAKGAFTGIGLEHDRFDFARAIMEGVAFGIRRAVEDFQQNGTEVKSIVMMGGAARSPVWMDMIASITNTPIVALNQSDVCALGAAAIAACGCGIFRDYTEAAQKMVHADKTYAPKEDDVAYYDVKFRNYDRMWQKMRKYYEEMN